MAIANEINDVILYSYQLGVDYSHYTKFWH